MILHISKVRSVAAGYICTCSELITKLQRTSYAKPWWEDTVITEHCCWRLLQDPESLPCYCQVTVTAENEDVWWGRADTQTEQADSAPEESQHARGTRAPPLEPAEGAGPGSSSTKLLVQHSWDPAQAGPARCPQGKRLLHTICMFWNIIDIKSDQLPSKMTKCCWVCLTVFTFPFLFVHLYKAVFKEIKYVIFGFSSFHFPNDWLKDQISSKWSRSQVIATAFFSNSFAFFSSSSLSINILIEMSLIFV